MPFISGTFQRPYNWQQEDALGNPIDPVKMDTDGAGVAAGLSNCILRDGTGLPNADIPWNGKGITGLRSAVAAGEPVTFEQLSGAGGSFNFCLGAVGL